MKVQFSQGETHTDPSERDIPVSIRARIKSKVLATAAALALIGGTGIAGVLGSATAANAGTPSCGIACIDVFSFQFGQHHDPVFLLDTFQQKHAVGTPIILYRASNNDPAEDFSPSLQGTVADFYAAGLVSSALALHYGCVVGTAAFEFPVCTSPVALDDWAFELQYAPDGVDSGLCVGLADTAVSGEGVTLQDCGVSSRTVWVIDQADSSTGRLSPVLYEYVPLINGSDTNFSQPFVLTYPQSGYPTDKPRPQLLVDNLSGYTQPGDDDPAGVDGNQLFGADWGPLP